MMTPIYGYSTEEGNQPWLSEAPTKAELRADPDKMLWGFWVEK